MAGRRRREGPTARVEAPAKGPHRSPFVSLGIPLAPTQLIGPERKCDDGPRPTPACPGRRDRDCICVFPSHLLGLRGKRGGAILLRGRCRPADKRRSWSAARRWPSRHGRRHRPLLLRRLCGISVSGSEQALVCGMSIQLGGGSAAFTCFVLSGLFGNMPTTAS